MGYQAEARPLWLDPQTEMHPLLSKRCTRSSLLEMHGFSQQKKNSPLGWVSNCAPQIRGIHYGHLTYWLGGMWSSCVRSEHMNCCQEITMSNPRDTTPSVDGNHPQNLLSFLVGKESILSLLFQLQKPVRPCI